ncbi:YggS family pyridoxal phosphate-dependent enzyme [Desulfovibrio litoralis]|uniref:Pyridoxal phosphate homeostasis protein n=1 Tax=Desulfovibrio litoralis DSM 11393 TaxID=1121455 RepID=A0A1M7TB15_9BACT|nr:YggS family pyridoxal phosphate-dependent enzyme [Desulfovibrio litoralis]SHN67921.1 hypothetical protein SAMN02745728_01798 [Desulfovibrio litoralis DSM 11393]
MATQNVIPDTQRSILINNLKNVKERIAKSVLKSGREEGEVKLVAISKFHATDYIETLFHAGQSLFGENYLQEAREKQEELRALFGIKWHFTGHIQSKKAKEVLGNFELLHTIDSLNLAQALDKEWQKKLDNGIMLPPQNILLQINTGKEVQKNGVFPEQLPSLADSIQKFNSISIKGLMCLPPFADNPEESREHFILLRELKERLSVQLGIDLPELSMGMSNDLEVAVEEGATFVRIGTALFGERTKNTKQ